MQAGVLRFSGGRPPEKNSVGSGQESFSPGPIVHRKG